MLFERANRLVRAAAETEELRRARMEVSAVPFSLLDMMGGSMLGGSMLGGGGM